MLNCSFGSQLTEVFKVKHIIWTKLKINLPQTTNSISFLMVIYQQYIHPLSTTMANFRSSSEVVMVVTSRGSIANVGGKNVRSEIGNVTWWASQTQFCVWREHTGWFFQSLWSTMTRLNFVLATFCYRCLVVENIGKLFSIYLFFKLICSIIHASLRHKFVYFCATC